MIAQCQNRVAMTTAAVSFDRRDAEFWRRTEALINEVESDDDKCPLCVASGSDESTSNAVERRFGANGYVPHIDDDDDDDDDDDGDDNDGGGGNGTNNSKRIATVPLCVLSEVQLRFLCPDDLEEVRALCQDWFPIDYPYSWYEDITCSSRFYALAAVYQGVIIGLIVAEIKPYAKLYIEDRGILSSSFGIDSLVGYILSLGVRRAYRRNGIASLLLEQLLAHVTAPERSSVKAIFLHVLSSNTPAILFYQRRQFRLHTFLPYYYYIRGKCKDGFTYVLYVNGGHAPQGLWDWMKQLAGFFASLCPCRIPQWIWRRFVWAATLFFYHR